MAFCLALTAAGALTCHWLTLFAAYYQVKVRCIEAWGEAEREGRNPIFAPVPKRR